MSKIATRQEFPQRQGLYDPANEHEACGVGFVVDIAGNKSHRIVRDGIRVLENLGHRGASGSEENTGDGAGILVQLPDAFLRNVTANIGIELPPAGKYAAGMVFLPRELAEATACQRLFEIGAGELGHKVIGWREVPTNPAGLGKTALESRPTMAQVFVDRPAAWSDDAAFERRLVLVRRTVEKSADVEAELRALREAWT